jgi:hypothetical protein
VGEPEILPGTIIVERDDAVFVYGDDDIRTTLDELLEILYR